MKFRIYFLVILFFITINGSLYSDEIAKITDLQIKEMNNRVRLVIHSENPLGYFLHERLNDTILMCEILNSKLILTKRSIPVNKNGIKLIRLSQYKENPAVVKVIVILDKSYRYEIETDRNELYIDIYSYKKNSDYIPDSEKYTKFSDAPEKANNIQEKKDNLKKVSFEFVDMNNLDILKSIGTMMNKNIIIDKNVQKEKTDFIMKDIIPQDALDIFITQYDLFKIKYNENTYIITSKENRAKYIKNKIQHVFKLINIEPSDVVKAIQENSEYSKLIDINRFIIDKRTRSIVVYDSIEAINQIGKIIKEIDRKLKQVAIELKIVEMTRYDFSNLGIEVPSSFDFGDIAKVTSAESTLSAHLDLLAQKNKAKILSSPKIRVIDGKTGTIDVSENIPVPYMTYSGAGQFVTNAGNSVSTVKAIKEWEQFNFGINLSVKPLVRQDNEIELNLNISVDDLIDIMDGGQPHTSSRSTSTYVRIKNGETVVLGGLVNQHETDNESKTPFIEKIPFLGNIFTRKGKRKLNTELVMFLTAKLVNSDGDNTIIASDKMENTDISKDVNVQLNNLNRTISN